MSAKPAGPISARVSLNFSFAKVVAIFTVVLGHFGVRDFGLSVWVPVTFGLFLFAFSSGYFTRLLYGEQVDRAKFWRKKLERLAVRYWVILAVIAAIVAFKGKTVLHWHSLVHAAGMSGVLNWFGIRNYSGLGAGLWFFTLLLLFYIAYPYLARMAARKALAVGMLAVGFVLAAYLQDTVRVGHMLWPTAYAFIAGVVFGAQGVRLPAWLAMLAAIAFSGAMVLLNLQGIKEWNIALITATSLSLALWLVVGRVPDWPLTRMIAGLEKYLLEIFLIHTYLFMRPTTNWGLNFLLSLSVIMVASVLVGRVADILSSALFRQRAGRG
ncbi:acyltransferase family protein [Massilia sp. ST3]|uniref:acyltransferase family protein n=1 Tax=Massilia sp. ST3 TaxID=2824903 RepID=UPI001B834A42|nr:acyltransferase family protein [Massilia sp. ST3]MBQ5950243.1 hypothetical protein [Massilia sp. ST3]